METTQRDRRASVQFAALPRLQSLPSPLDPSAMPGWELEFSAHGKPFKCFVRAMTIRSAEAEARLQLSYHTPDFDSAEARLIRALQVRT
ncbi:hypothetical protein [Hydrogenophaga laconesensis]|uniref:Uncharacterized protein n=1 Tax=Hydrogenophaga laconesensis TaxID=1805971 RepID=A0ABU1VDJ4_9BURK|nr:hypothetical protein [Hydrogenophaga laconesensis]MDR7095546.1 hypothetical protein [Hydrogenophaga laconesensis]